MNYLLLKSFFSERIARHIFSLTHNKLRSIFIDFLVGKARHYDQSASKAANLRKQCNSIVFFLSHLTPLCLNTMHKNIHLCICNAEQNGCNFFTQHCFMHKYASLNGKRELRIAFIQKGGFLIRKYFSERQFFIFGHTR